MWAITPVGRQACESTDAAIPNDYRRLLSLIALQGDTNAIKELLNDHPEHLVGDWLRELEELGFIVSTEGQLSMEAAIPMTLMQRSMAAPERAVEELLTAGAYLARDRRRPKSGKPRAQTVVLIVEDDPDQLALADLRVSMAGYQVRTAQTVKEMVHSLVMQGVPDLLVLDIMLPDGDGFEVLARLRHHPDFSELPIVMLTVKQDAADIANGLALGADAYVTKPYSKNVLVGVLTGILE